MLLTVTGRKTGKLRTTPVLYVRDGTNLATVASAGGSDRDPSWWTNLRAHPDALLQIKNDRIAVKARQASPDEKAHLWPMLTGVYPTYDNYQKKTKRVIPVVIFEPRQTVEK